jgi:HSP20 family protein
MTNRWRPTWELHTLQDQLNRLFQELGQAGRRAYAEAEESFENSDWHPVADVYEEENEYVIAIDLPGVSKERLDINLDQDKLVVKGERAIEKEKPRRAERPFGKFTRRFNLPSGIDHSAISATYKDGVLRVNIPRRVAPKGQRIEIQVK